MLTNSNTPLVRELYAAFATQKERLIVRQQKEEVIEN